TIRTRAIIGTRTALDSLLTVVLLLLLVRRNIGRIQNLLPSYWKRNMTSWARQMLLPWEKVVLLFEAPTRSALAEANRPPDDPATKSNSSVKPFVTPVTLSEVSIVIPATSRSLESPTKLMETVAGADPGPLFVPTRMVTGPPALYSKICRPMVDGVVV